MTTITIPRELVRKGDLVIVPRREYEKLLVFQEKHIELDRDLDEAVQQVKIGKASGPFNSATELKKSLGK